MTSDVNIGSYHVKHRLSLDHFFTAAKKVADYAVENKNNIKLLSSKYVKEFGLPSAISNQILRKYGRGTIKKAHNVNLINVPGSKSGILKPQRIFYKFIIMLSK